MYREILIFRSEAMESSPRMWTARIQSPTGEKRWVTLSPDGGFQKQVGTPTIGVMMPREPTVSAVIEGSAAETAGLKPGDLIQAVTIEGGGQPVSALALPHASVLCSQLCMEVSRSRLRAVNQLRGHR